MLQLFSKRRILALLALCTMSAPLAAWDEGFDCCPSNGRMYIGAFGGGLYSNSTKVTQMGTAFFTEAEGGPLAILAEGRTKSTSTGFGGVQVGYEWSKPQNCCDSWSFAAAGELEAFFYSNKKKGHLINPTDRLPEHDFADSFHLRNSSILVNGVLSLKSSCWGLSPYVGGGIGATHISIRHADSLQMSPLEAGVNHFNSKRNDTSWAFAAQAKAGVRYDIWDSFHIFAEYRYLFVDSSNYILGSTVYPNHAPTSPWSVKIKDIQYNAFVFGIQYDL